MICNPCDCNISSNSVSHHHLAIDWAPNLCIILVLRADIPRSHDLSILIPRSPFVLTATCWQWCQFSTKNSVNKVFT